MNEKIVLIDNELIIREKITLYDLHILHPEILIGLTPTMFRINEDYIINGTEHIDPISFIRKSEFSSEYWTKAGVAGYFTFKIFPDFQDRSPGTVYYRQFRQEVPFNNRGNFNVLPPEDQLFYNQYADAYDGIEFCRTYDRGGDYDELGGFYTITDPTALKWGLLLIPLP